MWGAVLLLAAVIAVGPSRAQAAGSGNSTNDILLALAPDRQAASLANSIGHGCVGISAFPMGVTRTGAAKGFAYWSVRCKDGRSFAIQINPAGQAIAVDCQSLQATGRECFRSIAASPVPAPQPPSIPTTPTVLSGSGFFVSANNDVITNVHVVQRCRQISMYTVAGKSCPAVITGHDFTNDLALLSCNLSHGAWPRIRLSARVGEEIVVYGFPLSGTLASSGNVTAGNITALAGIGDDIRLMQLSAPVQPGNSGGPVLDRYGNIVGVVVSQLDALKLASSLKDIPQNVNFAIKSSVLEGFLESNGIASSDAGEAGHPLSTADIAGRAKAFTVRVECVQ